MASSKVMASRSPPNPDRPRQSSPSALNLYPDHTRGLGSMNMDDLFRNIYPDSDAFVVENNASATGGSSSVEVGGGGIRNGNGGKTVEEVWRDIVSSETGPGPVSGAGDPAMTLEDFLAKAGAVTEEDVRVPAAGTMAPPPPTTGAFGMETAMMNAAAQGVPAVQFGPAICVQNGYGVDFGNGMAAAAAGGSTSGSGRGKRRAAVEEVPLDKATQQKQRRMIKNRESAARSRERKQAYTVELESLVTQLEEDNARLLKEESFEIVFWCQPAVVSALVNILGLFNGKFHCLPVIITLSGYMLFYFIYYVWGRYHSRIQLFPVQAEMNKERYKQLMTNLIPVVETQRRPRKLLRRVHSMEW